MLSLRRQLQRHNCHLNCGHQKTRQNRKEKLGGTDHRFFDPDAYVGTGFSRHHSGEVATKMSENREMITIQFLNVAGGGFANHLEIPAGTDVGTLFTKYVGGSPESYYITVNRDACRRDQVLQHGDKAVVTPAKVAGA